MIRKYQERISSWVIGTFGEVVFRDARERAMRVLEEASELAQAIGVTSDMAHHLVDYVWSRPTGNVRQEIAGTLVTTLALSASVGEDAESSLDEEVTRIELPDVVEKCRRKHSEKSMCGVALPGLVEKWHGNPLSR